MAWKFVCDLMFHEVLQTTIIRQIMKGKSSISDIEHFPNYITLGSPQTLKVN